MERRDRPLAPEGLTPSQSSSEAGGVADPVLVLAGPTAVGKSSLALAVAEAVGAEIVSADSRQVYRGLDVGTATPPPLDRERVVHHLVNDLDPAASFSAGQFRNVFFHAITDVNGRGGATVVVGGSTLYVHALVRGIADLPALRPGTERTLRAEGASAEGRERLFRELQRADPEAAATLDPSKSQRLVRLVGLLRDTGRPPSELWEEGHREPVPHRLVVLDRPRAELYDRIDRRVDAMLEAGWVEEVDALLGRGPAVRALLDATIGYREIAAVLDGTLERAEAVRLIKRNTRRYAKRQLTWYRRYDEAVWLDARTATVADVLEAAAPWPSNT